MDKIRRLSVVTLLGAVVLLVSGACSVPAAPNKTDDPKTEPDDGNSTAYLMPTADSPERVPARLAFDESGPLV